MLHLAAPVAVSFALAARFFSGPALCMQGVPSSEVHGAATAQTAARPTLSDDAREAIDFLRYVLAQDGREGARELLRETVAELADPLPGEEQSHILFLLELDRLAKELECPEESRRLCEAVLGVRTRILQPDHTEVLEAELSLADARIALGDIQGARELEEQVHEARSRLLNPDHPFLLAVKFRLASSRAELGDLRGAEELEEQVVAAFTRILPADHHDLLKTKQNLAVTKADLGDLAGAQRLGEEVLAAHLRVSPPDDADSLAVRNNLALVRYQLGDLEGARELFEAVVEAWTRQLPADDHGLLAAKENLSITRRKLGDLAGAQELEEQVYAARARILPADHHDLLVTKQNLAVTRYDLGDQAGAQELLQEVLALWTRQLSPDHPDLLATKQNLAVMMNGLGNPAGARELGEEVLAARTRLLPADHPDLVGCKNNVASVRYALGDVAGARELLEEVRAAKVHLLPPDHADSLQVTRNLAVTRVVLGDCTGACELFKDLLAAIRVRASALRAEAVRPAREGALAGFGHIFTVLHWNATPGLAGALDSDLFATLEELRLASVSTSAVARALAPRPDLAELAARAHGLRSKLNDLAAAPPQEEAAVVDWRRSLVEFAEERDRAERELRKKLAEAGSFVGEIDSKAVANRLAPGAAVSSFLRYQRFFEKDPETGEKPPSVDSLLAFVVKPDGSVRLVELGAASEVESLVTGWRAALGRPLEGRGSSVAETARVDERLEALGTRLREGILDPIFAEAPGVRTLHVVLDDLLHLVPLDALPLADGLVGERIRIRNEVTLARLLRERAEVAADGGLTAAGGIDYEAELGAEALVRLDAATPPTDSETKRSGAATGGFSPLAETSGEAASIAELYRTTFEREASVLSGSAATKAALFAAAPKTRILHLATHGWFASESFKSQLDSLAEEGARKSWQRAEETLTGFAPETLCGLALAGANRGKDALGRVPGILTAEELASFDLRNCELAVLSACETNVGIRRAGQGIQSLQTALHAAGARTAITSLWKVDDAATRRLFELFYTKLWKEKLRKADALWQAKMALRAEGHPLRDWAGWVLSGDPD